MKREKIGKWDKIRNRQTTNNPTRTKKLFQTYQTF